MSNGILIGLTDQGKTWVTKYNKLIVLLKKIIYMYEKNVSEIMFGWCLTFDAVYMFKKLQTFLFQKEKAYDIET